MSQRNQTVGITTHANQNSSAAVFAASELQRYLRKMTGVEPKLSWDEPLRTDGSEATEAIALTIRDNASEGKAGGAPETLQSLVGAVTAQLAGLKSDGFVIRSSEGHTLLAGANGRGLLYAVYYLLERLGARFFAPEFDFYEGHAEYVPSIENLSLPSIETRQEPSLSYRRKYVEEGHSHTTENLIQMVDWMSKARLNTLVCPYDYTGKGTVKWDNWRDALIPELRKRDMLLEVGGHGYESFLQESVYGKEHPDWFPSEDEAATGISPNKPANIFRVTNPEALDTYIRNVVSYLKERPEIDIFDAWPTDGASWLSSDVERFGGIANAQAYVALRLNETLKEANLKVRLETLSYIPATDPPSPEYMYDESFVVDIAPYDRSYSETLRDTSHPKNQHYSKLILTWRDSGFAGDVLIYEYYRKYSWKSLPVILPKLIGVEIPYYHSLGATGLGIYAEPGDWITYELTQLLTAAMSWDATIDPDTYVHTYLAERYGEAATEMSEYLKLVEHAGRSIFDRPAGNYQDPNAVTTALESYRQAERVLASARSRSLNDTASFLIGRLHHNLEYAVARLEAAHHKLQGNEQRAEEAESRMRRIVEARQNEGIVLAPRI